jgi:branched-subunit amino acid ABC-type transport system permease component
MALFIASLIAGVTLGGTFALIGLGLVLAFRATKTFNFAHGGLMLLPAFVVAYLSLHGINIILSITVALAISGVVGSGQGCLRALIAVAESTACRGHWLTTGSSCGNLRPRVPTWPKFIDNEER